MGKDFEISNNILKRYKGPGGDVVIPSGVTEIGEGAFYGCSLTSINIPESVMKIGREAFIYCRSLTNIKLSDNVIEIGEKAFEDCLSLISIKIPVGIKEISKHTFWGCESLTSITLSEGITKIGESAFRECSSLKEIKLPKTLSEIGEYAFERCSSLTSIEIPFESGKIGAHSFDYCTNLTNIKIPSGVEILYPNFKECKAVDEFIIENDILLNYRGNDTKVKVPCSVKKIGDSAFCYSSNLKEIELPEGLTEIGAKAFWWCDSLKSIKLPEGLTKIGAKAFLSCKSLKSIEIPKSVKEFGNEIFWGCDSLCEFIMDDSQKLTLEMFGDDIPKKIKRNRLDLVSKMSDELFIKLISKTDFEKLGAEIKIEKILILNRKGMEHFLNRMIKDPNEFVPDIIKYLQTKGCVEACNATVEYMITYYSKLSDDCFRLLYEQLKSMKLASAELEKIENDKMMLARLSKEKVNKENLKAELLVLKYIQKEGLSLKGLENKLITFYGDINLPGISDENQRPLKPFVLQWILTAHEENYLGNKK